MSHKGQKRINKIATGIRETDKEIWGFYLESVKDTRKFVKEEKLHYTKKMAEKARALGRW